MISDWQLSEPPISTVQIPDASWPLGGVNLHFFNMLATRLTQHDRIDVQRLVFAVVAYLEDHPI